PIPLLSCADSHSPSSPSLPPFLFHCSPPFYYPPPSLNPAHVPFALTRFTGLPTHPVSVSPKRTSTAAPALPFSRFLSCPLRAHRITMPRLSMPPREREGDAGRAKWREGAPAGVRVRGLERWPGRDFRRLLRLVGEHCKRCAA